MAKEKRPRKAKAKPTKAPYAALIKKAQAGTARNRKVAEKLVELVRSRLERIERDFHAIGVALNKLSAPAMYTSMGYSSLRDLLKGEKLLAATTAYRLMAVAESFKAGEVKKIGAAKAYALLSYAEATPAADVARELARGNAKIAGKPVATMSVRELTAATKKVRGGTGRTKERSALEKEARSAARKLQASLRKDGMKSVKAQAARKAGVWAVSVVLSTEDAAALVG